MTRHPASSQLLAALAARLGPAHVVTEPADMAGYLVEERGLYRGTALAVARPRDTAEVGFVVKECAAAGVPVVAQSGNTGLTGGGVPYGGVVLSLARLDRVREVDAVNATMTVEAGCILRHVQEAASAADCLFPLSLASEGSCRIGGNLSTNAGGTGVLRYGNARDLVLGLEVVLADGRVWNGLKGLRKDNAGYDLKNLFVGSEGTLGIITAAVLKLFPKPKARATAFVGCASARDALAAFDRLRQSAGDTLSAFEYINRFGLEVVLKHASGTMRPLAGDHHSYALTELSSPQAGAELEVTLESVLGYAIEEGIVEDATIGASETQNAALWRLREQLSDVQRFEGGSIKHDVSVPVSAIPAFMAEADAAVMKAIEGARICSFGHMGDGNIHYNISQPVGADKEAFIARWHEMNHIVHGLVLAHGGSISAEHGIGQLKRDELASIRPAIEMELMRRIKRAFDPAGIMNPDKVVSL
jgi:FAD/FMN-containing dehydrogenase